MVLGTSGRGILALWAAFALICFEASCKRWLRDGVWSLAVWLAFGDCGQSGSCKAVAVAQSFK